LVAISPSLQSRCSSPAVWRPTGFGTYKRASRWQLAEAQRCSTLFHLAVTFAIR
jgi:hypothetical protein